MNVKIETAMMPGSAIGMMMRSTACGREQPSIMAASSSSSGIDWKKDLNSHMLNGSENVV